MEIILFSLVFFAGGALLVYFILNSKGQKQLLLLEEKEKEISTLQVKQASQLAELDFRKSAHEKAETDLARLRDANTVLQAENEAQKRELQLLKQQQEVDAQSRKEAFEKQLELTKAELEKLTQQVLEQNAEKLKVGNAEHLGHITRPLKESIEQMKRTINEQKESMASRTAAIGVQVEQLLKSNQQMEQKAEFVGQKAEKLATALKGENKTQGNWGEVILGNLLAGQGLVEGRDYEVQTTIRDARGNIIQNEDSGKAMRPDVILHYPENQDVIIDSKVSLTDYLDYVNAISDEERASALKKHVASIRTQAKGLSQKDYSSYIQHPRKAIEFVVMFVPNESALQLALSEEPRLWNEAFENKVLITGEQNLMTILRIIKIAWVQYQQAENQQKVFGVANELLKRVGDFVSRFEKVGEMLDKAKVAFDDTQKKVFLGQQSVLKKAHELVSLGAKEDVKHKLPLPEDDANDDVKTIE